MSDEEMLRWLTPAERSRVKFLTNENHLVRKGKKKRPLTFREFVDYVKRGRYRWHKFAIVLARVLQRVADKKLKRVIVVAPPRHGKSEPISRLFPAYYLYRWGTEWVGLATYGAELSHALSRNARENYAEGVGLISGAKTAVKEWHTGKGGGMWSAGMGGPLVGKGGHLLLIDDPLKNVEEASSERIRQKQKEWYSSSFYTRLEPDGAVVIIMQRWHEDDLVGWLLEEERANADNPIALEHWHIVHFEALKESAEEIRADEEMIGHPRYPSSCTMEPDWRKPGAALAPARYSRDRLLATKGRLGNYFWNALFQQRPRAREGAMFPLGSLRTDMENFSFSGMRIVRVWDYASTSDKESENPDYTSGVLMAINRLQQFCILDVTRGQWGIDQRNKIIRATAEKDFEDWGGLVVTWREQEPGSSGKDASLAFVRLLKGYKAHTILQSGDKVLRAEPLASTAGAGNLFIRPGLYLAAVRRSFVDFPSGNKHDDDVDAASTAHNILARKRQGTAFRQHQSVSITTLS